MTTRRVLGGFLAVLLFAGIAGAQAPTPVAPVPTPQAVPPPVFVPTPQVYGPRPGYPTQPAYAYMAYNDGKKNEALALVAEFFVPGLGSIYGDHVGGALTTWALFVGGTAAIIWGLVQMSDGNGKSENGLAKPAVWGGLAMMLGGRIYGFVDAYQSTSSYNDELRARLGLSFNLAPVVTARGGVAVVPRLRLTF